MYLCPVDWNWIKQRPQFLAEELAKFYDVYVVYPYRNNRKGLQKREATSKKLFPYYTIPTLGGRLPLIGKINNVFCRLQMEMVRRKIKPDILYLTMPWQIDFFPKKVSSKIVYDCMDDYAAIAANPADTGRLVEQETKLVKKADVVFVSSENLRMILQNRYHIEPEKLHLLRNGYNANWKEDDQKSTNVRRIPIETLRIAYFGTIGRWFDFDLLLSSLKKFTMIEYHLFGPMENSIRIPPHDRLVYHGVVEHDQILKHSSQMHGLMMPFVINDIVRSVDPVKLYEYIWIGKPIISVRYPEIERFDPYVSFYGTREEFFSHIDALISGETAKYTQEQAIEFLKENNWKKRAELAHGVIDERCEWKEKTNEKNNGGIWNTTGSN